MGATGAVKLSSMKLLGIKTESTQGTAATLTTTDFCLAEVSEPRVITSFLPRNGSRATLDQLPHAVGKTYVEVRVKLEVKGSGSAGTPWGPLDALLQASGMSSTASPGVTVTYAPLSLAPANFYGPGKSCTIECYHGIQATGLKYQVKGCLGMPKFTFKAGEVGYIESTLRGVYTAISDAAAPSTSFNTTIPPIFATGNFTIHSFAAVVSSIEVEFGNTLALRDDVNSAYGVLGFIITGRDPKGSIDPEAETVASHNFTSRMLAGTEGALAFTLGATSGNTIGFTIPKAQYAGVEPADRDGIATFNVPLKFNQSSGDDWISIVSS